MFICNIYFKTIMNHAAAAPQIAAQFAFNLQKQEGTIMFCPNCGNQMNGNARFCPFCGAQANGTPPPPMTQPQPINTPPALEAQPPAMQRGAGCALPPGMESIEDGPFYWTYSQSLWSNPTILYTVLKVMIIAVFIILLLIGGLSVIEGDFDPVFLLYLTVGLSVGASVLSFLGYAVFAAISGGKYNMLFIMDDDCIMHTVMPKEAARGNRISDITAIVGVLTGNPTLTGMGMANSGRHSMTSNFAEVKSIVQDRAHDLIKVRAGLEFNQIYASPAQYDFVLSYIASHCPGVRVE